MAQAAPAPLTPAVTVKIQNGGQASPSSVHIEVGQEVEIHNTENTPYEIPIAVLDQGVATEFPLAIYLPAGGKLDLIGMQDATCQFWVNTPSVSQGKGLKPMSGPYTIGVGSGEPGGGKK